MPIKLKVFIQVLQKSHNRHKISFAFEFNNKNIKNIKKDTIKLDLTPDIIRVNICNIIKIIHKYFNILNSPSNRS